MFERTSSRAVLSARAVSACLVTIIALYCAGCTASRVGMLPTDQGVQSAPAPSITGAVATNKPATATPSRAAPASASRTPAPHPSPTPATTDTRAAEPVPSPPLPTQLVSDTSLIPLYWSQQQGAFVMLSWEAEQWTFDPSTGELRLVSAADTVLEKPADSIVVRWLAYASPRWEPGPSGGRFLPSDILKRRSSVSPTVRARLEVDERWPYEPSLDGTKLLYHRNLGDIQGDELWLAHLPSGETRFVYTTSVQYDMISVIEDMLWRDSGAEALLTRQYGESLQLGSLDASSGEVVPLWSTFDADAQEMLAQIGTTFIALSPGGKRLAFVGWTIGPGDSGLWIADLDERRVQYAAPAYHGATPRWSPDGRYVYYLATRDTVRGERHPTNPIGVSRFDFTGGDSVILVQPGDLGDAELFQWALSSDERHLVYLTPTGTWSAEIQRPRDPVSSD